ncbi:MAG: methyltransferase domain-containing protein [Acidobacteriota bacterium]
MANEQSNVRRFFKRSELLVQIVRRVRRRYRRIRGVVRRGGQTRRYLRELSVRKLQLGAGRNLLDGWLNTDFNPTTPAHVYVDARDPLPFGDRIFDYIFTEHLIEHLSFDHGARMLAECRRVLRPGGWLRVATPDLGALIGLYGPHKTDMQLRYVRWIADNFLPAGDGPHEVFVINNAFHNYGHKFLYDFSALRYSLEKAGFVSIKRCVPGESDDVALRGIESHGRDVGDEEMNRFETMVVEARRPAEQAAPAPHSAS